MKIDNNSTPLPTSSTTTSTRTAPSAYASSNSAPVPANQGSSTVNINPVASQLQALEGQLGNEPAVDASRVAEIRQAIRDGKFSINPEAIADKLVASVKDLLS